MISEGSCDTEEQSLCKTELKYIKMDNISIVIIFQISL